MSRLFSLTLSVVLTLIVCAELSSAFIWYTGPLTSTVDDAKSEITCPNGYYVSRCFCVNENTCDGTQLQAGNIRYCFAGHRYGVSQPTRVTALCRKMIRNVVTVRITRLEGQYAFCPRSYQMQNCFKRDPWSQYRTTYLVKGSTNCTWKTSSGDENKYVHLSLVCTRRA